MRMSELKRREVINVCDCKRLGFVGDLDVDPCTGRILAIIVPGPGCVCGFLGREKEFVILLGTSARLEMISFWSGLRRRRISRRNLRSQARHRRPKPPVLLPARFSSCGLKEEI